MFRSTALTAAAAALAAVPALAETHGSGPATPAAVATLASPEGADMGEVRIFETGNGLLFHVEATGLTEGWHGFHVHQTADCSGDLSAAGGHYAPDGSGHGYMAEDGYHAGDLPNIHADETGAAMAELHSARLTLSGGEAPVMDEDGSAIIIHADPDTYRDEAGAGGRVACGVIEPTS